MGRGGTYTAENILYGETRSAVMGYTLRKPLGLDEFISLQEDDSIESGMRDTVNDCYSEAEGQYSSFFGTDLPAYITYLQKIYQPGCTIVSSGKSGRQGILVKHTLVTRGIKYNLQASIGWVVKWSNGVEETLFNIEELLAFSTNH